MASRIIADNYRLYKAHQQDNLLSEVAMAICVLLPRAYAVAGFGRKGNVLLIRYNSYTDDHSIWDTRFFERQLLNDPLLAMPQLVAAVFIGSEQQLLVPDALYRQADAAQWLSSLYPVTPQDELVHYPASRAAAQCLMSLPAAIRSLVTRHFTRAKLMPVTAYQLEPPDQPPGARLQFLMTGEEVFATLHLQNRLIWHHVFPYIHAADIAWQFTALCKQLHLPVADLHLHGSAMADLYYDDLLELETYFPKLQWTARQKPEQPAWEPVIYLMEALYTCVS